MAVKITQLAEIVGEVFDDETVELTEATTAKDVEGWDSLSHIRFIVTVEQRFNLGDLLKAINAKLPS